MARSLYVAAAGPESGKSAVALGVVEAMVRRVGRVGLFRPVVRADGPDPVVALVRQRFPAVVPDDAAAAAACGVTYDDVHTDPAEATARIVERFRAVEREHDAVLVVGTDYTDVGAPTELAFNGHLAVNLGAPVLLVVNARGRTPADVAAAADVACGSLAAHACRLLGVVANRVDPDELKDVQESLAAVRGLAHGAGTDGAAAVSPGTELAVHVLPEEPLLSAPTVQRVVDAVGGDLVLGAPERLAVEARSFVVAAMTLPRVLEYLREDGLVIVPGDRSDVLVGVLMAHRSQTFPRLSGVILSGGTRPEPPVQRLLDGIGSRLPVAVTPLNTFEAATVAAGTRGALTDGSARKIATALDLFAAHVDGPALLDRLDLVRSDAVTPLMFEHDLVERARATRRRIVLPEGTEPRVLAAAAAVLARGIADVVLLGDPAEVARAAARAAVDVSRAQVLDPAEDSLRTTLATEYARQRAHRGVTFEAAWDVVVDVSYAGTLLVELGMADGMVSGAAHTTAHTIRPAFEVIRTVPGVSVVSSVFFMCLADRVLVYGDCAVNPDPTAEQLADIAISSATTAASFGVEPRVAMLSYSTGTSGAGKDVDKVREATRLVRERAPHLQVEGPIQYDAAIDAGVARTKLPDSTVAGRATVFVFPDLNTGNNTYKAVQRSAGALAVGPVLQGLRKPVNDLSRGATVPDIVTTIAITAVQATSLAEAAGTTEAAEAAPLAVAAVAAEVAG
ncbi:phosphate acetyltransferase [Kineosporia sp. R_H_3]|uniref:phosphate acetyltransferase n=1 Tax=Kineosporia sp. R_H_3 TaxID=1961848 RepID=UPI000B4B1E01|nr:phosphate acetyltransferase [Kineosporia sp. R_H_3]